MDIGSELQKLRASKGWSLQEAAKQTGVTYQHIFKIEKGIVKPGVDVANRLLAAYGKVLSITDL